MEFALKTTREDGGEGENDSREDADVDGGESGNGYGKEEPEDVLSHDEHIRTISDALLKSEEIKVDTGSTCHETLAPRKARPILASQNGRS